MTCMLNDSTVYFKGKHTTTRILKYTRKHRNKPIGYTYLPTHIYSQLIYNPYSYKHSLTCVPTRIHSHTLSRKYSYARKNTHTLSLPLLNTHTQPLFHTHKHTLSYIHVLMHKLTYLIIYVTIYKFMIIYK